jgi:drug/metabolite transporter superfamily protein YnfA
MDKQTVTILLIIGIMLHIFYTYFTIITPSPSGKIFEAIGYSIPYIVLSLILMPLVKMVRKNDQIFENAVTAIYLGLIVRIIFGIIKAT